jgi:hypothetical protein
VIVSASAQAHPAAYSNKSLKGWYAVLGNKWLSNQDDNPNASLSIVDFDGAGNLSGSMSVNTAGTVSAYTVSGTYSVSKTGTGTMNMTLSGVSGSMTSAVVLDSSGKSFQFVQTACTFCGDDTNISTGTGIAMGASSFTNASLKGSYEFMIMMSTSAQNSQAEAAVGVLTFDGVGKVQGSLTDVSSTVQSSTLTGTYSVNSDGSGSWTAAASANGDAVTFSFVVNSASSNGTGAKGLLMLKTAEPGHSNWPFSGTATKQ